MVYCDLASQIWLWIIEIITLILIITMIPIIYKYVVMYRNSKEKKSKSLIYPGFFFFIAIYLTFCTLFTQGLFYCRNDRIYQMIFPVFALLYSIQFCLLLILLFIRLYFVFNKTCLQLSNKTIISYCLIYIVMFFVLFAAAIFQSVNPEIANVMVVMAFLLILILIVSIIGLFIYKIIQVYKSMGNDQELIGIITKATILTFVSIFITCLSPISIIAFNKYESIHVRSMTTLIIIADLYSNFICIVLEYDYFNGYYHKLCSCMDIKCRKLWNRMVGVSDETKAIEISKEDVGSSTKSSAATEISNPKIVIR